MLIDLICSFCKQFIGMRSITDMNKGKKILASSYC